MLMALKKEKAIKDAEYKKQSLMMTVSQLQAVGYTVTKNQ